MEILINCLKAFLVGGAICLVGQILIDYTKLTPARILVSFVVAGVILSALGIYGPLVDFAGAGATVPLTGFGHLLAQGVKEAVAQYGFIGIFSGGVASAGAGIGSAIIFGYIMALLFKPGDRTTS
jgi:stage V sporulation protein AE